MAASALRSVLPTLDVWLAAEEAELHRVDELLPILEDFTGTAGVRLEWAPRDIDELRSAFLERRDGVKATLAAGGPTDEPTHLWPSGLSDFLSRKMQAHFSVRAYKLDPKQFVEFSADPDKGGANSPDDETLKPQKLTETARPLNRNPLTELIHIDIVNAQRHLGGEDRNGRLSRQVAKYYNKHLDFGLAPEPQDLEAIRATQSASSLFDLRLRSAFEGPLAEIARMGYPGGSDPRVVIRTSLQLVDGLTHNSVLRYQLGPDSDKADNALELPEGMNGLGYQNLVLMIFNLMLFRDGRHKIGKASSSSAQPGVAATLAPIHLVLVEEPEAHLHAQVQQVFIKHAYATLKGDASKHRQDLGTQLIVSTHSSHIAHEINFSAIRYFRRQEQSVEPVPLTTVRSLAGVFGNGTANSKFVQRYIKVQHCNVLFADGLVLLEGAAERILVPHLVSSHFKKLDQSYIEFLDIGGAHAHTLRPLVEALGIPTLVITDIDAATGTTAKKARPASGQGQISTNYTLANWLGEANIDALIGRDSDSKTVVSGSGGSVHFAYQTSDAVLRGGSVLGTAITSTFEDALAFANFDMVETMKESGLAKAFATALQGANKDNLDAVTAKLFKALSAGGKAKFAMDVLAAISETKPLRAPGYIHDGLLWLQGQVSQLPLVAGLDEATSAPAVSSAPAPGMA
ncbi:ATP-dependent nuclease [Frigoribacterium sp. Leaf263]|uniref:ATP-dependent nuclease n=1 Tax=Frigoribacterium sp. Leaf263 TaxID=1736313 RepID=UPI0009E81C01|nr:AAA family ATPase [Frigoribacterium sp. Leaf263]